jgi:hypothetical protein
MAKGTPSTELSLTNGERFLRLFSSDPFSQKTGIGRSCMTHGACMPSGTTARSASLARRRRHPQCHRDRLLDQGSLRACVIRRKDNAVRTRRRRESVYSDMIGQAVRQPGKYRAALLSLYSIQPIYTAFDPNEDPAGCVLGKSCHTADGVGGTSCSR